MLMRRSLVLSMVSPCSLHAPTSPSTGLLSHQHPGQIPQLGRPHAWDLAGSQPFVCTCVHAQHVLGSHRPHKLPLGHIRPLHTPCP